MKELEAHCFSETKVEVGGFLVGHIEGATARVTAVVRAKHSVGKSTQLTFTHDTWNALHSEMNELDGTLIGWYHSHPNFGVFLSEHDQFIQKNFFKQEGNINIVIDPVRGRRGWFYSSNGKIVKYQSESDTTRERLGKSATNSDENIEAVMGTSTGGVSMGKVVMVSAITSLLGAFLGFGLSNMTSASGGDSSEITRLSQEVELIKQVLIQEGIGVVAVPTAPAKTTKPAAPVETKKATPKATATSTSKSTKTKATSLEGKACKSGDAVPAGLVCKSGVWKKASTMSNSEPDKSEIKAPGASDTKTTTN
jgi:proteasome lid subunit RPN8/RPN11